MSYTVKHEKLLAWVQEAADLCTPDQIYWCDGSKKEYDRLMAEMVKSGAATLWISGPTASCFVLTPAT